MGCILLSENFDSFILGMSVLLMVLVKVDKVQHPSKFALNIMRLLMVCDIFLPFVYHNNPPSFEYLLLTYLVKCIGDFGGLRRE